MPVDRHRSGHKTYILVSRREVKNRGDVDEFNVEWNIRQGFLQRMGYSPSDEKRRSQTTAVFSSSSSEARGFSCSI